MYIDGTCYCCAALKQDLAELAEANPDKRIWYYGVFKFIREIPTKSDLFVNIVDPCIANSTGPFSPVTTVCTPSTMTCYPANRHAPVSNIWSCRLRILSCAFMDLLKKAKL
jgi:hypothetical protein